MASAAARRYARAAFELAQEGGDLEGWAGRLEAIRLVLADPSVRVTLGNPTVPVERRQEAMEELTGRALSREVVNLAKLLVAGRQIDLIDGIDDEFQRLADEAAGRVRATVTAAVELESGEVDELRQRLSTRLGREVRLQVAKDPRVLGGLVIRYGDHMVDASLAARLQQLRRALAGAS